jgi:hypothetical protein
VDARAVREANPLVHLRLGEPRRHEDQAEAGLHPGVHTVPAELQGSTKDAYATSATPNPESLLEMRRGALISTP